jgi:putative ABC transport system permease protein
MGGRVMGGDIWSQMLNNPALLASQYDVLAGRWPQEMNEVILVVDENNEITDMALYSIGLKDANEINEMMMALRHGGEYTTDISKYSYNELLNLNYKMVLSSDLYQRNDNAWVDMSGDFDFMTGVLDNSLDIRVVGIVRPSENSSMTAISGSIGYLHTLTEHIVNQVNASEIVREQRANPEIDVFTGKPFADPDSNETAEVDISSLSPEVQAYLSTLTPAEQKELLESHAPTSATTYEDNLALLGVVDLDTPSTISIYPRDFAAKESMEEFIKDYNKANEETPIRYTDFVGMMMSSVSTIIGMISTVLIAFVGISLVVSSIMIGIITYVSVLERTKEIGILKSIGASKKDISRVFNAETMIVGFTAGALGVGITALLTIPANIIIKIVSGVSGIAALPIAGAIVLVLLSTGLTLISGLIPSRIAANKDPVVALRTE